MKISKKRVIIIAVFAVLVLSLVLKNHFSYGDTKKIYISSCQSSIQKAMPMSRQKIYSSCVCSHNNLLKLMGKHRMKKFTKVISKKDVDKTNAFLAKENIPANQLDSAFLSCF